MFVLSAENFKCFEMAQDLVHGGTCNVMLGRPSHHTKKQNRHCNRQSGPSSHHRKSPAQDGWTVSLEDSTPNNSGPLTGVQRLAHLVSLVLLPRRGSNRQRAHSVWSRSWNLQRLELSNPSLRVLRQFLCLLNKCFALFNLEAMLLSELSFITRVLPLL